VTVPDSTLAISRRKYDAGSAMCIWMAYRWKVPAALPPTNTRFNVPNNDSA
jgi:hypothetical protein